MKNLYYYLFALGLALILISCKKVTPTQFPLEKNKELTTCPPNSLCDYYLTGVYYQGFQDCYYSIVDTSLRCSPRTTIATSDLGPIGFKTTLLIKIPNGVTEFEFDTDMKNGLVQYSQSVTYCNVVKLKPLTAHVKGKKMNFLIEGKTSWLIDAEVVLAEISTNKPADTLYVTQYFN